MNKYYFEILENEYTINVMDELIGSTATFEGSKKAYEKLMEYEVFELNTMIGDVFLHEEDIKLIGVYDMKKVKTYDNCINAIDKFEGTYCFDEILTECEYNLEEAIYSLKLILDKLLNESETEKEIKFYSKMLNKINPINTIAVG